MVINWYGQSCFKIQSGQFILAIDPFDKSVGLTPPKFEANAVLVSHDHSDHNNIKALKGDPFVIGGPGEYEYQGVRVNGIDSYHDDKNGKERGLNTIYRIQMEGMVIVHAGDLGHVLTDGQVEEIGDVDILMIPVGGVYTIDGGAAVEVVNQIQPRVVIPMHYKVKGLDLDLQGVEAFLGEIGKKDAEPQEKFSIKKSNLPQDRMDIVVLKN